MHTHSILYLHVYIFCIIRVFILPDDSGCIPIWSRGAWAACRDEAIDSTPVPAGIYSPWWEYHKSTFKTGVTWFLANSTLTNCFSGVHIFDLPSASMRIHFHNVFTSLIVFTVCFRASISVRHVGDPDSTLQSWKRCANEACLQAVWMYISLWLYVWFFARSCDRIRMEKYVHIYIHIYVHHTCTYITHTHTYVYKNNIYIYTYIQ